MVNVSWFENSTLYYFIVYVSRYLYVHLVLWITYIKVRSQSTLFEVDRRGVTRVVIRNSRTNNKRRVNAFVYEELLIIDNFNEIYFLKTNKGNIKKGKILSKHG